jgi:hypothetical protein
MKPVKQFVEANVDIGMLIYSLNQKELLNLIKEADKSQEDWGFTEKVCVYFLREMLKAPKEECTGPEQMVMLAKDKSYKL